MGLQNSLPKEVRLTGLFNIGLGSERVWTNSLSSIPPVDSKGVRTRFHMGHRLDSGELSLPNSWATPHRTAADSFCEMVPIVHHREQGTGEAKIQWFLS